ncbi:Calcineurin-like phosphoesterase [Sphingomonas laterariae]|uniref:Calcineurin-like phosphoesterase n=1 Tax=Edaphosphingomonas laterariae TaxID=861865 RepID=A0A239BZU8_9SPHN|nr:metallophosphoesterase [Sphingomonas laterariae]SNS12664.1 Calcineurin-like phosphoesterase [Sphingomonas laterariae]
MAFITQFTRRALLASAMALAAVPALAREAQPDTSFTIAVLPDTQNYMDYTHQKAEGFPFDANEMFFAQMQYVADNLESAGGDIAFVTSLGDVWQHQTLAMDPGHEARGFKSVPNPIFGAHFAPTPKVHAIEMPAAKKGFEIIAGKVPFSVVPGNHDYDAMWTDANHPPAAKINPKDLTTIGMLHPGGLSNFKSVFGAETPFFKGKPWYVASNDGGADSAQIFEAGGYRFLHIGLQFDAPNSSLEWAAKVVAQYPGLPTIVSTHDYMDQNGRREANPLIDAHAVDPEDNNPEMVWQKFISQHDQIFLVLCGHQHGQAMRVDRNKFGHNVYQVLADYQDRGQSALDAGVKPIPGWGPTGIGDGWLRLMRFDLGAEKPAIHVKTFSTHYKKLSGDTPDYAKWYRPHEQPKMTDDQFMAADDFVIDLGDFRQRFDRTAKVAR